MPEPKKRVGRPPKVGQGLWEKKPAKKKVVKAKAEIVTAPIEDVSPVADYDKEQRELFARMLSEKMPLEERVEQLIQLARLTDTKRAPVGLRAIQEINAITGVHDPKPQESNSMFVFPQDTKVNLQVEKVVK